MDKEIQINITLDQGISGQYFASVAITKEDIDNFDDAVKFVNEIREKIRK